MACSAGKIILYARSPVAPKKTRASECGGVVTREAPDVCARCPKDSRGAGLAAGIRGIGCRSRLDGAERRDETGARQPCPLVRERFGLSHRYRTVNCNAQSA